MAEYCTIYAIMKDYKYKIKSKYWDFGEYRLVSTFLESSGKPSTGCCLTVKPSY